MIIDICVIGGGPAGLFSAYYAESRGMRTILIEGSQELGGRINYFLDYPVYDVPGQFGQTGRQIRDALIEQIQKSPATIVTEELVGEVQKVKDVFLVTTAKNKFVAKTVISAVGNGFLLPKRLEKLQLSKTICYDVPDFKEKLDGGVAILGHTPTAADWAIQFKANGNDVALFPIKDLNLQPILMKELEKLHVPIKPIERFEEADYDKVYCHIGTEKFSVKLDERVIQRDNGYTTLPGYFVAGDARFEQGKIKLIHGATHDAMQAVNAAKQYLDQEATYQPIVSTHEPKFKEWNS
jgi:ferredoxin/flavodoxin---NADP+ reductase